MSDRGSCVDGTPKNSAGSCKPGHAVALPDIKPVLTGPREFLIQGREKEPSYLVISEYVFM